MQSIKRQRLEALILQQSLPVGHLEREFGDSHRMKQLVSLGFQYQTLCLIKKERVGMDWRRG